MRSNETKLSHRWRERVESAMDVLRSCENSHRNGQRLAASHYWPSSSYSWPSGTVLKVRRSEAVNNSAPWEMILVDKGMKKLVQWLAEKRARTGPLRMYIADRSTILTILSSGAGRAFIRNESSDEEPVRGLKQ